MSIDVDPDWWRTLFDGTYLLTDARSVGDDDLTRREVDVLCDLLAPRPGERLLDLCGGQGRHSLEMAARGLGPCTVVDYSPHLVERGRSDAAARGLTLDFVRADARETGLEAGGFDHVLILGNSLGYLPETDDDRRIFAEAHRLAAPGARLLVDVVDGEEVRRGFNPNAWHEIGDDVLVCRERELDGDTLRAREIVVHRERGLLREATYAIRFYAPEALAALVASAGFGEVEVHRGHSPHGKGGDYGFMNRRVVVTARKEGARR